MQLRAADGTTTTVLTGLASPSDVDRLDDGGWISAENAQLRRFDAAGKEVWRHDVVCAVEVNVY